ncbi:MAG: DUF547 domain-containing protein [Bryobacterales bacterium]|nr:DUF547 domain-containing protein [Bryobacterales bacterium]
MDRSAAILLNLALAHMLAAAGPDPAPWDALLKKYVDTRSRVDYAALARQDREALDAFLRDVAAPWPAAMDSAARKAALINAYNALTVRWIVTHYPVASIQKTPNPFKAERHTVDGRTVSLDQIESELRAMGDPRVHSVLVCAARSCPPLRREAYTAGNLEAQLDDNTRAWLADPQLNELNPDRNLASVSPIFQWYRDDFDPDPGLHAFLARYAPGDQGNFEIEFKEYDWGLNNTSPLGSDYSKWELYADAAMHQPAGRWMLAAFGLIAGGGLWWLLRRRG